LSLFFNSWNARSLSIVVTIVRCGYLALCPLRLVTHGDYTCAV